MTCRALPPRRWAVTPLPTQNKQEGWRKMIPLIQFIIMIIDLYTWVIIASAVLSWLIAFGVVNTHNRFVYLLADGLHRLTEPALRPIRQIVPDLGGIDISPIVLILGLIFIKNVVLAGWIAPMFL
jgi:YggT family protein